jgi:hypothetical protein
MSLEKSNPKYQANSQQLDSNQFISSTAHKVSAEQYRARDRLKGGWSHKCCRPVIGQKVSKDMYI